MPRPRTSHRSRRGRPGRCSKKYWPVQQYTHTMPFPARPMFSVAPRAPSMATLAVLESALSGLRISTPAATGSQVWRRHASHQAQGRANKAADGAGKRLGAKKSGGEYVVPGNILFKQRGTLWFPGDNCSMVRSHERLDDTSGEANTFLTGPRPHNPRRTTRLRPLLPRSRAPPQAQIHRNRL